MHSTLVKINSVPKVDYSPMNISFWILEQTKIQPKCFSRLDFWALHFTILQGTFLRMQFDFGWLKMWIFACFELYVRGVKLQEHSWISPNFYHQQLGTQSVHVVSYKAEHDHHNFQISVKMDSGRYFNSVYHYSNHHLIHINSKFSIKRKE